MVCLHGRMVYNIFILKKMKFVILDIMSYHTDQKVRLTTFVYSSK